MHRTNAVVTSRLVLKKASTGVEVGRVRTWTGEVSSSSNSSMMTLSLLRAF